MMNSIYKRSFLFLLSGVLLFSGFKASEDYFEISKNLDIFASVYKEIHVSYVDETKPGELIRSAIDAMLRSLDPYTNFYSEAQAEDYLISVTGAYGGLGATVRSRDNKVMVDNPYEGFAAQKADLRAGDYIIEVDGNNVVGKSAQEVTKLMKGQAGSNVKLKIERPGVGMFEKEIERENIKVKNVPYFGMINNQIGYIQLTGFTPDAGKEVKDALLALKKNESLQGVILDLRGNGGGLLHEAVNIVNVFVKKGQLVVNTKGKVKEENKSYSTLNIPVDTDIRLAVLIDERSASASEIVSGTVQDLDRGVVLGRKSFGKGLVQQSRNLSYGTQMKITISKYYIPSGRCIQKLDYGHKENGKAIAVADSAKQIFYTLNNKRPVIDSDGVSPDVLIVLPEQTKVAQALVNNYVLFDYATDFRNRVDSIPNAKDFVLSESDFQTFLNFMKDKEVSYTTETERALNLMEEKAQKEAYFEGISDHIKMLKKALERDKEEDVVRHKEEIMKLLRTEIARRYQFQTAEIETTFDSDPDVLEAIKLLLSPDDYFRILNGKA